MRYLRTRVMVFNYDELSKDAQKRARYYIECRGKLERSKNKVYPYSVQDFEWFATGQVMFYQTKGA